MLLKIVAAGTRMPAWVDAGFDDFASRLRGDYRLELVEIPLGRRTATSPRDAVRVFYGTGLDLLVLGRFLVRK